jgi:S-adenosyl-L-methionine hydrolase (adenosine-forming)
MEIITLTTDMGLSDHYVASLKGTILSQKENVQIVDISHKVKPFDISEAAYLVRSCYDDFPDGTIHIIGVDSEPIVNFGGSDGSFPSILFFNNQYFISNDNGFFGAFLRENTPTSFWRMDDVLSNPNLFKFPTKNMLITAGLALLNGKKLEDIASPSTEYKNAFALTAISELNRIKGHVVHIDNYGNAITNIHKSLFDQVGKDVPFIIYFKRETYYIDIISGSYNEVMPGEKVAIFNENNFLEIAINRGANGSTGGAEQLFGLHVQDMIRIEFTPKGSRDTLDSLF